MAVAYDAVSSSTTNTNPGINVASFNWSHDPVAAPAAAVVFVLQNSSTDEISGVTYGGVAMEDLGASYEAVDSAGEPGLCKVYFLSGAALPTSTSVQTVEVTCTNNGTEKWAVCLTFTGAANKLLRPTGVVLVQGDGTLAVQSVNDGSPGSNSLRCAAAYYGGASPAPAGTGSTSRATLDSGNYGYAVVTETTAGQGARNVGFNNATSDDRAAVHFAVAELYNFYARTATDTGLTISDSIARALAKPLRDYAFSNTVATDKHASNVTGINDSAASLDKSQGFTAPATGTLEEIRVALFKWGTPTGTVTVEVFNDDGSGFPDTANSPLGSFTIPLADISNGWYTGTVNIALTAASVYHIVVSSSASVSGSNYVSWWEATRESYLSDGSPANYNGTNWSSTTADLALYVGYKRDNLQKTSASNYNRTATDTGLTQTDTLLAVANRRLFDNGLAATYDYQTAVLDLTPTAFWRLDGASRLDDETANAYDLTAFGTNFIDREGLVKGTDGSTQFSNALQTGSLELADSTPIDAPGTASYSVAVWVEPSRVDSTFRRIVAWNDESTAGTNGYRIEMQQDTVLGVRRTSGTDRWADTTDVAITPFRRYLLVTTYDGSNIRIYVDGVLKDTFADTNSQGAYGGDFRIGTGQFGSSSFYGTIDDVAVWAGTVLTDAQIQDLYIKGVGGITDSILVNKPRSISDYGLTASQGKSSQLFADDFSEQRWAASSGSPTRVTSPLHSPEAYSLEINPSAGSEYVYYSPFGGTPARVVAGFWWRMPSLPGANGTMIAKIDAGPTECRLRVDSSGAIAIAADGTPSMSSVFLGSDLVAGTWYWIELMIDKSANPWVFRARINNTVFSTSGAAAASNCGSDFLMLGNNESETFSSNFSYVVYGTAASATDWMGPQQPPDALVGNRIRVFSDTGLTQSDSLAKTGSTQYSRTPSDTGLSQSDTLVSNRTRVASDTGLTQSDTLVRNPVRAKSDTGLSQSDTLVSNRTRVASDTGLSQSDTLVSNRTRVASDTGLTQSDSLVRTAVRPRTASDTGLTQTDTLLRTRVLTPSDTGLTQTDTLARNAVSRTLSDTGLSQSDTLAERIQHGLSDTGLSQSDTLVSNRTRVASDTGLSQSDTLLRTRVLVESDTGLTQTDTLARNAVSRTLSDTGLSQSDTLIRVNSYPRTASDTGLSQSDALATLRVRVASDTGLTQSDSLVRTAVRPRTASDTGLTQTDTLASNRTRVKSDTGLTQSDTLARNAVSRTLSDTGLSQSDTLAERIQHGLSDTGLTQSDTLARNAVSRTLSDTGLSQSDALVRNPVRVKSDTGLTQTDTLLRTRVLVESDTGLTQSDTLVRNPVRVKSDTGLTQTDTLVRNPGRVVSDTGLTQTDTLVRNPVRAVSDTGLSQSDTLAERIQHGLSDTGLTQTDALARNFVSRSLSDTGLSQSDSLSYSSGLNLNLSDTGLAQSDALASLRSRLASDTGLSQSDTLVCNRTRVKSDTGLTQSDTLARNAVSRTLSDTGLSQSDTLAERIQHGLSDTGLTQSDTLVRTAVRSRTVSDTGLTQSDTLVAQRSRTSSDTGLSQSDTLVRTAVRPRTVSDTGLSQSDSLVSNRTRVKSDTGLTQTDSFTRSINRALSDTGLTFSESLSYTSGLNISISDTGLNQSDSLARTTQRTRSFSDTGLSQTDSVSRSLSRTASDAALSFGDSLRLTHTRSTSDDGLTFGDSLSFLKTPGVTYLSDTGLTQSDSLSRVASRNRSLADTGLVQTDAIQSTSGTSVTDAGLVFSESLQRQLVAFRVFTDTGLTFVDAIAVSGKRTPKRARGLPPHRSTATGSVASGRTTGSTIGSRARGS